MKKTLYTLAIIWLVTACSEDQVVNQSKPSADQQAVSNEKQDELKLKFGKVLAEALADSPPLRKLIKDESLKMFDNDYDVLYHMIKDTKLSDKQTVRDLLLTYFENENQIVEIETGVPLLTIFVPELPENTFSAKIWNVDTQIPSVGITSHKTNDVTVVDAQGNTSIIEAQYIPAFPVIVIKENERVVATKNNKQSVAQGRSFQANDAMGFTFLASCFDGSVKTDQQNSRLSFSTHQKLIDAYNIYNGTDGWHRDYIYYNITPSQDRGAFSYDYQERIRSFTMQGDPVTAFSKIADQTGDPKLRVSANPNSGWTGGAFEFKVRVLLNAKNGIGEELITYFPAQASDLFTLEYTKSVFVYIPRITGLSGMALSLPLFAWDLNDYASTVKIEIEEVDNTETIVTSESRTVKFATNFSIEGVLKKIGLKFGASLEETRTQSVQRTYTVGNDVLGSVIVNFADNILLRSGRLLGREYWVSREYATGWYSISVEPVKVQ